MQEDYKPLPPYSQKEKCKPRLGTIIGYCAEYGQKICPRTCYYAIEKDKENKNTPPPSCIFVLTGAEQKSKT